jgi:hypothetical protein
MAPCILQLAGAVALALVLAPAAAGAHAEGAARRRAGAPPHCVEAVQHAVLNAIVLQATVPEWSLCGNFPRQPGLCAPSSAPTPPDMASCSFGGSCPLGTTCDTTTGECCFPSAAVGCCAANLICGGTWCAGPCGLPGPRCTRSSGPHGALPRPCRHCNKLARKPAVIPISCSPRPIPPAAGRRASASATNAYCSTCRRRPTPTRHSRRHQRQAWAAARRRSRASHRRACAWSSCNPPAARCALASTARSASTAAAAAAPAACAGSSAVARWRPAFSAPAAMSRGSAGRNAAPQARSALARAAAWRARCAAPPAAPPAARASTARVARRRRCAGRRARRCAAPLAALATPRQVRAGWSASFNARRPNAVVLACRRCCYRWFALLGIAVLQAAAAASSAVMALRLLDACMAYLGSPYPSNLALPARSPSHPTGQCCEAGGVLPGGGCCKSSLVCGSSCCSPGQTCVAGGM